MENQSPQLSRREFLSLAKESGKALTLTALMATLRGSFKGLPRPNTEGGPSLKPPERTRVYETEIRERLIESILNKVAIVDVGLPSESGVEGLSEFDTWRVLTQQFEATEQEYQEKYEGSTLELTPAERVAQQFLWIGGHGPSVLGALEKGLETSLDYHQPPQVEFAPFTHTEEQLHDLIKIYKLDDWQSESGKTRGPRMVIEIAQPDVQLEAGKIGSGSFQFGKLVVELAEEERITDNLILTHTDLRSFLAKHSSYKAPYNKYDSPDVQFVLPPGKGLQDIARVEVITTVNEVEKREVLQPHYLEEVEFNSSAVTTLSEDAPIESYVITMKSGEVIEAKATVTEQDLSYRWQRAERLTNMPAIRILGAFNPENPFKDENVEGMKQFLMTHSENFWVMALGNYGDELSDDDMAVLPQNYLPVGQSETDFYQGQKFIHGTYGQTVGSSQTIFATNDEFGITADGSSFATPQVAAAVGLYATETLGKPITRAEVLAYFADKKVSTPFKAARVFKEGMQPGENSWNSNVLELAAFSDWFDEAAKEITEAANAPSRRDFLRGKLR